jgi:soluble lytic murein transglycosylase-like protein
LKIMTGTFFITFSLILMSSSSQEFTLYSREYVPIKTEIETYIETAGIFGIENNVEVALIAALIFCESSWNPNAVNINANDRGEDQGLMQLNSRYLLYFSMKFNDGFIFDPFDPFINIKVGARYLKWIRENIDGCEYSWRNVLIYWNGSGKNSGKFADKVLSMME